jgi:UDP-N-acetylglucosamine 2-epimerase (non-hydrolysing)
MPEEINRRVTDAIADWLFCTEQSAVDNLLREGKRLDQIFLVGNVMVDTLFAQTHEQDVIAVSQGCASSDSRPVKYAVLTLHRPSNVDSPKILNKLSKAVAELSRTIPIVFPVHPRTRTNIERFAVDFGPAVTMTNPLGYSDFLRLWKDAAFVLTDSGGLQEETTALGVPCLTLRNNTERPITVQEGTNTLVGTDPAAILAAADAILRGQGRAGRSPPLWDGKAAQRIIEILCELLKGRAGEND